MKKLMFITVVMSLSVITACSTPKEEVAKPAEHTAAETKTVKKSAGSSTTSVKKNTEVAQSALQKFELDHILLSLPKDWKMNKGLDSASFQLKGDSIGGIDGLGYNDSIESLLPNQSIVLEKQELTSSAMKTYSVTLQRDTEDGQKIKEIHFIYLLPEQKIAYDLHFDLSMINESYALNIAKSAMKK